MCSFRLCPPNQKGFPTPLCSVCMYVCLQIACSCLSIILKIKIMCDMTGCSLHAVLLRKDAEEFHKVSKDLKIKYRCSYYKVRRCASFVSVAARVMDTTTAIGLRNTFVFFIMHID